MEEKVNSGQQALEDLIETYFKKISNLLRAPFLTFPLFLKVLLKILGIYTTIISPKPLHDDHRKVIVRTYEQLKIEQLLKQMLDMLKKEEIQIMAVSSEEPSNKVFTECTVLLLKIFIVNIFIVEFINNTILVEVLMRLMLIILQRKLYKVDADLLQCQFFRLLHLIVDISQEQFLASLHKSLAFSMEFRNKLLTDYMVLANNYEKESESLSANALVSKGKKDKNSSLIDESQMVQEAESKEETLKATASDFKDEVYKYFYCWYGVSIPSAKRPDFLPEYSDNKNSEIVIYNLQDIVVFMR